MTSFPKEQRSEELWAALEAPGSPGARGARDGRGCIPRREARLEEPAGVTSRLLHPRRGPREAGVDKAAGPFPKASSCSTAVGHLSTPRRFGAAAWRDREGPGGTGV